MSLMDAPAYDAAHDRRNRNIFLGLGITVAALLVVTLLGFVLGHGWLFSNLGYEHRVNNFFNAIEAKDYAKAYGIYNGDPAWQQHPERYTADYPLDRFTDDWTTHSPVKGPIDSHHVDISKTDGSGTFGSGIIVAVRLNMERGIETPPGELEPNKRPGHKIFMYVNRKDKTMTWPAPHELGY